MSECALCRGGNTTFHDTHPMGLLHRIRLAKANDLLDKAWAKRTVIKPTEPARPIPGQSTGVYPCFGEVSTGWPGEFTDDDPEWFADQQAEVRFSYRSDEWEWIDPFGDT